MAAPCASKRCFGVAHVRLPDRGPGGAAANRVQAVRDFDDNLGRRVSTDGRRGSNGDSLVKAVISLSAQQPSYAERDGYSRMGWVSMVFFNARSKLSAVLRVAFAAKS